MARLRRRGSAPPAGADTMAIRTLGTADRMAARRTPPPLWADLVAPPPPEAELDGVVKADVCVIGLGATGLSAAEHLARRGAKVVGLDAGPIGGGASGRNAGMLSAGLAPFHHDLIEIVGRTRAIELYQATLTELAALRDDPDAGVEWTGSLRVAHHEVEAADCRRQLEIMRRDGLPVEEYHGPEGAGLLFPWDGRLHPAKWTRKHAEAARTAGASLFAYTEAQHVGERDVSTSTGEVRCRSVVVAVDGGLERIVPALDGVVRTARAQMLATGPTWEIELARPVCSRWGYDYWQQLPDGRIVLGGQRDHGGDDEWTHRAEPTDQIQSALDATLREHLGVVHAPVTHRWAGSIGFTDDGLPTIARLGASTIAVGGYNGTGNLIGPMLGRAVADLALGDRSPTAELFTY